MEKAKEGNHIYGWHSLSLLSPSAGKCHVHPALAEADSLTCEPKVKKWKQSWEKKKINHTWLKTSLSINNMWFIDTVIYSDLLFVYDDFRIDIYIF